MEYLVSYHYAILRKIKQNDVLVISIIILNCA